MRLATAGRLAFLVAGREMAGRRVCGVLGRVATRGRAPHGPSWCCTRHARRRRWTPWYGAISPPAPAAARVS